MLYHELQVAPGEYPGISELKVIGSRLKVQTLLAGKVQQMAEEKRGGEMNPVIELYLQLFNADNGEVLWSTFHRREGRDYRKMMHFGVVDTVSELAKVMTDEIYREWHKQGFARCEN